MTLAIPGISVFMGIFVRLSGMFAFNPLFNRRNVPYRVRAGLILALTILLSGVVPEGAVAEMDTWVYVINLFKELALGLVLGYIFQVFYYMIFFVGDILDTMFGLSMAKTFDPGTNIQMSVTGNLFTILFICYFITSDNHLAMIHLFASSFQLLPLGTASLGIPLVESMIQMFIQVFALIVRLALPFAVIEFVLEIAMGILMKVIPQIHVFVINFQLKLGLGMVMLFLFSPYVSAFVDNYMVIMMDQLQNLFTVGASGLL